MNKVAMEMWQIVMIILVLIFLFAVLIFYGMLGGEIGNLLDKFANIF